MTGWPYCLAEIALYAVFGGIVIAMALDARDRWKQLHVGRHAVEHDRAAHEPHPHAEPEISVVRRRPGDDTDDTEPPPLAS